MRPKPKYTIDEEIENWRSNGDGWGKLATRVFVEDLIAEHERRKLEPSAGDAYARGYKDGLTAGA